MVKKSINRKGKIILSPKKGFWTVGLLNGNEYKTYAGPSVHLSVQSGPEKVGVFVVYQEGLVSLYSGPD